VDAPRAITFLPGDPPRTGVFAAYDLSPAADRHVLRDGVELVVPAGTGVRRRTVPARRLSVADAIAVLGRVAIGDPAVSPSVAAWSAAMTAALGIMARGRLFPSVTANGWDTWRAGPLDPSDRRLLEELAAAFPAEAHAVPIASASPLRVHSPGALIRAAWDALADTLPRTAGAGALAARDHTSPVPFATTRPIHAVHLTAWLADAAGGLDEGTGADVALRVELPMQRESTSARAVIQLTSRADPSLVVDASDLFDAPQAVLSRFGEAAEVDLLRALRRGARAWPPIEPLLRERAPGGLDLDDDLLAELLADAATALQGAGLEVLWPSELVLDGIRLRASVTPAPGNVVGAGLSLSSLVEFRWQATLGGDALSGEEIDQLVEVKRGGVVRLRGRWVVADRALIERLRSRGARRLTAAEALGAMLAGSIELDGHRVDVAADGPLGALTERLRASAGAPEQGGAEPPGIAADVQLRPYQARGVAWLRTMTGSGLGGCLADDMGLGKTLQVIALHLHRAAEGRGSTLVVCPTSLLANWEREVRRFAPGVRVRRYHGPGRDLAGLGPDDLVVTSYGVARTDTDALVRCGFSLVVADEAQHAKNPATATARSLRQIPAAARLALTGTPVENRLSDLWSILDWTTPGLLGPLDRFLRAVATPVERYRDRDATERLARTVRPFMLRRRKTDPDIAPDLPARIVSDVPVALTAEQVTLYEAEVRDALAAIREEAGIERQASVLRMLTVLKQICNHPAQYLRQRRPLAGRSGKLAALEELVDIIRAEGESVLVFSQFVACLSLIRSRLEELGMPTLFLHGGVPAARRTAIVDGFQSGIAPVLLLSLKVGGVGLNLTRATHVIHYDRWWNPATEDQATDRAHRIGQDRTVQVHRLIAEGTLEDRIAALIERKRSLAEAVAGGGEAWLGRLSDDELAELVELGGSRAAPGPDA
jgi:superfamily II DNA or RNA helicase